MAETDGIGELFEQELRTALMGAGRIGEQLARLRTEKLRSSVTFEQQAARDLTAQYESLRATAVARLRGVDEEAWWQGADTTQITEAYQTAVSWADQDPAAAAAAQRIRDEVLSRYGLDIDTLQIGEADLEYVRASAERARAREEEQLAAELIADIETIEHASDAGQDVRQIGLDEMKHEADLAYDSAERRDNHAANLENAGVDKDTTRAWKTADVDNARPATEAVSSTPRPRANSARPKESSRTRDRGVSR